MSTENVKSSELKAYKHVAGKLDIRRFLLESNSTDLYAELIGKLVRAYKVEPSSFLIYWKDSEGDFVSIETEDDVRLAIGSANGTLLKLYVADADGKFVSEEFGQASTETKPDSGSSAGATGGVHHPFVTCDGCNSAIFGRRFKCVECADYDLCERCEMVFNRHPEHNMMLIRRPSPTGCPYMFAGRRRMHGGPQMTFPGCPAFGPRGPHCGRFRCPPQPQPQPNAEKQSSESEQTPNANPLEMRFADLLREVQNGQLPVVAAMNEALRPYGADLNVLFEAATGERCDSATSTERGAAPSADSSEQAGAPAAGSSEQSSQARPSTSSAAVETARVETNDKPTQSGESLPNAAAKPAGRFAAELQQLTEMGFYNIDGDLEKLLVEKRGNVVQVLDVLMRK